MIKLEENASAVFGELHKINFKDIIQIIVYGKFSGSIHSSCIKCIVQGKLLQIGYKWETMILTVRVISLINMWFSKKSISISEENDQGDLIVLLKHNETKSK